MLKKIKRAVSNDSRLKNVEIDPDEIFLDSTNLPKFDTDQFEGRFEKSISKSTSLAILILFGLISVFFIFKLWSLQIENGNAYALKSENNRLRQTLIFSKRGVIEDRNKIPLAWNTENPDNADFSLRAYSTYSGTAHVIGYVKYPMRDSAGNYYQTNYDGKDGIEKYYNDTLSGTNGLKIVETDALGEIQSEGTLEPPKDGENITLSIDAKLNDQFFRIIGSTAENFGFVGGSGAIMDVDNGEIISLVSYPEYSPSILADGKDENAIENYFSSKKKPFINRAISGLYIPGSIIKPFIAYGALAEKIIDPSKKILSAGSISLPNPFYPGKFSVFKDWKALGWIDMRHAIAMSSDIYFYTIGGGFEDQRGIGIANIEKYLRFFGIAEETGIDLPGEISGVIPNPAWKKKNFGGEEWRIGDTYNSSIGQYGFQVTPIQMLRGITAIANDGNLVQPTVILGQGNQNQKINLNLNQEYLKIIKEGMRLGTLEGTSVNLNVPFVNIAAKTGTAELGVAKEYVNSLVMGFYPYENPKYSFIIIMERGSVKNTTGAVYAMLQLMNWINENASEYLE